MSPSFLILLLASLIAVPVLIIAVVYLVVPVCKGIIWLIAHLFRFLIGTVRDLFRSVGAVIAALVFVPLIVGSILIGRWSAASHFGRAFQNELATFGGCIYRLFISNPARLLCIHGALEGVEQRVPQAIAAAPGRDRPASRQGQFPGYTIVGSLPGGGSGGRLYVAEPDAVKQAGFERAGRGVVDQVVIKSFSLSDGSTLPQIIRESQALTAARRLGLILDHELSDERFFYVMEYVPGDSLGIVTQRLHGQSDNSKGLGDRELRKAVKYTTDLVRTLSRYHEGGLWHKDVKPDNIIIAGDEAHLVDFGLITPLRSGMTLTTHGTEYFRDPEMVRMALRGVKVHQVDGAKFDIYAAGAVLYSMVENSFPAHGGLSVVSKRCPEALRWVIRRAMTEYDKRYDSAAVMLADLQRVLEAKDPFALRPVDLPSVGGGRLADMEPESVETDEPDFAAPGPIPFAAAEARADDTTDRGRVVGVAATPAPPKGFGRDDEAEDGPRRRPNLSVLSWWSGRYALTDGPVHVAEPRPVSGKGRRGRRAAAVTPAAVPFSPPRRPLRTNVQGVSAKDQLRHARERAQAARQRAHDRMQGRHRHHSKHAGVNAGVAIALFLFLGACVGLAALLVMPAMRASTTEGVIVAGGVGPTVAVEIVAGPDARANAVLVQATGDVDWDVEAMDPDGFDALADNGEERVLLVRDDFALRPENAGEVALITARLESHGFEVLGVDDDGEEYTDSAADLRAAVGTQPFLSEDANRSVLHWLGGRDDVASVLWVGRDERAPDRLGVAFILGGRCSAETRQAADQALRAAEAD